MTDYVGVLDGCLCEGSSCFLHFWLDRDDASSRIQNSRVADFGIFQALKFLARRSVDRKFLS
jgi:hypothetical protein